MAAQLNPTLQAIAQRVEDLLAEHDLKTLRGFLAEQHPADIADMLEVLDDNSLVEIFNLLQIEIAAEVLDETRTETTRTLVEAIPYEQVADLLEALPMDDAAEILAEIPEEQADDILALMEPEEAADVEVLLAYPEETAGRLMTGKVARLKEEWTVKHALQELRHVDTEVETLAYLYVVNGGEQLVGLVPIWALLTAPPDKHISDLMETSVISVHVETDQEEVARIVGQYDFFAIPVIDHDGRFMGIITHDDVVDILEEEFTEDVQKFGGSAPLQGTYLSTPIFKVVQKRVGWLLLLFVTATLTGSVMRLFQRELNAVVALSIFIPLLIGTGGNAGSQMTATMIRSIAVGEVRFKDLWRVLGRELLTGLLLGAAMGLVGLARAWTWEGSIPLALTVASSLCVLVVWANLMGVLLPVFADRVHIDPAVISGPVMSTLVDATGLLIYFSLARVIIGL